MHCRICGAQNAQGCDCQAVIEAQALRIMERFGRIRKAIAQMDSRDLLKREVKNSAQVGQGGHRVYQ